MSNAGVSGGAPPLRYADIIFVNGVLDPNGQNPKQRRVVVLTPDIALAAGYPIVAAPVTSQVPPVLTADYVLLPFKNPPGTRHQAPCNRFDQESGHRLQLAHVGRPAKNHGTLWIRAVY
jgi:hypothetical protein